VPGDCHCISLVNTWAVNPSTLVVCTDPQRTLPYSMLVDVAAPSLLRNFVKRRLTIGFKSSKPIQIGLCRLMSLSITTPNVVRHDICRHSYAVERRLVIAFCGQPPYIVTDPTIRQPGFDLPHHTWSLMSGGLSDEPCRTGQGPCRANLHKSGLAQSPSYTCNCGQRQTMNHIVDTAH